MNIIHGYPPNYDAIKAAFNPPKGTIFCFAPNIYNPDDIRIPQSLIAHEAVHIVQQRGNPATWWKAYIESAQFRLDQEIPAHIAEYISVCRTVNSRRERRLHMREIAKRLSGPLYGRMMPFDKARGIIKRGAGINKPRRKRE